MDNLISYGSFILTILVMLIGIILLAGTIRMNIEDEEKDILVLRSLGVSRITIIRFFIEEMYNAYI
jgi:ABC-type antimicrobial peptide transport system permease subunit